MGFRLQLVASIYLFFCGSINVAAIAFLKVTSSLATLVIVEIIIMYQETQINNNLAE